MSPPTKKSQREIILYLWNVGTRTAKEIHTQTSIPLRTIYDTIQKIKKTGTVDHARGNGRPTKITKPARRLVGQYIRRNPTLSTRTMATKLAIKNIVVSHSTISRYLASAGYSNSLPQKTPMLTDRHKKARMEWARKHFNDDWNTTFFSDETAFQLFRNTVKHWHKGSRPFRRIPKNRTKIKAWGDSV
jgi:transposase